METYTEIMAAIQIICKARRSVQMNEPPWDFLHHSEVYLRNQAKLAMLGGE